MMNERENFFAMFDGLKNEYVPSFGMYCKACALPFDPEFAMVTGGMDGFGVNFVQTPTAPIPEPNRYLFEDMEDWRECVHFPDLDKYDYKKMAEIELADFDPEKQVLYCLNGCVGPFTRLEYMIGFENALIALAAEPEEFMAFADALADYHIKKIDKILEYYPIDVMWYGDDVAHSRGMFMSPDSFRELIMPSTRRVIEYMRSKGTIVAYHCCGKCESIVPDLVDMGVQIWNSAQPSCDLVSVQKEYGSRLVLEGGWNSQGKPGTVDATADDVCTEMKRCLNEYGPQKNFIIWATVFNEHGVASAENDDRIMPMMKVYMENRNVA